MDQTTTIERERANGTAIELFRTYAEPVRDELEDYLHALIPPEPKALYGVVEYTLVAGGKRVRPILTAIASHAVSPGRNPNWLPAAAAIELLHTFTLVHDDIMDNAESRRGLPTAHVSFGRDAAILAGDVLIALANRALAAAPADRIGFMLGEFADGFASVCEGQALDKAFEERRDIGREDYLGMIQQKTAAIFELAAVLGAHAGGGGFVEDLRRFARHIGIAFQVLDDLLDLTALHASFGKTIGGDILEGKRSFLFVEAMAHYAALMPEEQALMDRIETRRAEFADIALAKLLFERLGVLERSRELIEEETRKGQHALRALPESAYREALFGYSEFLLGRAM